MPPHRTPPSCPRTKQGRFRTRSSKGRRHTGDPGRRRHRGPRTPACTRDARGTGRCRCRTRLPPCRRPCRPSPRGTRCRDRRTSPLRSNRSCRHPSRTRPSTRGDNRHPSEAARPEDRRTRRPGTRRRRRRTCSPRCTRARTRRSWPRRSTRRCSPARTSRAPEGTRGSPSHPQEARSRRQERHPSRREARRPCPSSRRVIRVTLRPHLPPTGARASRGPSPHHTPLRRARP